MWLAAIVPLALLIAVIASAGPCQYDPMSPDEEREWLRALGVAEAEIDTIQDIR